MKGNQKVQCFVVGDGEERESLEFEAEKINKEFQDHIEIKFLGGFRVECNDLRQADLVVGQGRTVLEAIACGVPASVCGKDGYFGLVSPENFQIFAQTNFTGRGINNKGSLCQDLEKIDLYFQNEMPKVYKLTHDMYDVNKSTDLYLQSVFDIQKYYSKFDNLKWKLFKLWIEGSILALKNLIRRRLSRIFYH